MPSLRKAESLFCAGQRWEGVGIGLRSRSRTMLRSTLGMFLGDAVAGRFAQDAAIG